VNSCSLCDRAQECKAIAPRPTSRFENRIRNGRGIDGHFSNSLHSLPERISSSEVSDPSVRNPTVSCVRRGERYRSWRIPRALYARAMDANSTREGGDDGPVAFHPKLPHRPRWVPCSRHCGSMRKGFMLLQSREHGTQTVPFLPVTPKFLSIGSAVETQMIR
jgi:hypothetical protein